MEVADAHRIRIACRPDVVLPASSPGVPHEHVSEFGERFPPPLSSGPRLWVLFWGATGGSSARVRQHRRASRPWHPGVITNPGQPLRPDVDPVAPTPAGAGVRARRAYNRAVPRPTGGARMPPPDPTRSLPADEDRPDGEAHQEQPAQAVEQVDAVPQPVAVRVDDPDGGHGDGAVEDVELRHLQVLPSGEADAQPHLDEQRALHQRGEPPQGARAQAGQTQGPQRPQAGHAVADDDDERPGLVDLEEGGEGQS